MRNFKARLKTLELKNPTPCTAEQEKAFRDIISYLDSLAERKACGEVLSDKRARASGFIRRPFLPGH